MLPPPWPSVLQGAGIGAALGGGIAAAGYYMKLANNEVVDLKVDTRALKHDRELLLVLSRFTGLRDLSARTRQLYETVVSSCDFVLDAERRAAKGAEQVKASRAAMQAIAAAKALCREAAKIVQTGRACEQDPYESMREIEALETQVNDHLHNSMLE